MTTQTQVAPLSIRVGFCVSWITLMVTATLMLIKSNGVGSSLSLIEAFAAMSLGLSLGLCGRYQSISFSFEVGSIKKHTVKFHYYGFSGNAKFFIDGTFHSKINQSVFLQKKINKSYKIVVGENEKFTIQIIKYRHSFFPLLFPQQFEVIIDGNLISTQDLKELIYK